MKTLIKDKKTPADNELELISPKGQFNFRVKAFLCAAHSHCLKKTPEEIAEMHLKRGRGVLQKEFALPLNMVISEFPITFQKFVLAKSIRKKKNKEEKERDSYGDFAKYLFNRLYYMYYQRIGDKGVLQVSGEHPISQPAGSEYNQHYQGYLQSLKTVGDSPLSIALLDLENLQNTISCMQTVLTQTLHAANSATNRLLEK